MSFFIRETTLSSPQLRLRFNETSDQRTLSRETDHDRREAKCSDDAQHPVVAIATPAMEPTKLPS
jgi:hypothetical protein